MVKNRQKIDLTTFVGEPSGMVGECVWRSESARKCDFMPPDAGQRAGGVGRLGEKIAVSEGFSTIFRVDRLI